MLVVPGGEYLVQKSSEKGKAEVKGDCKERKGDQ